MAISYIKAPKNQDCEEEINIFFDSFCPSFGFFIWSVINKKCQIESFYYVSLVYVDGLMSHVYVC